MASLNMNGSFKINELENKFEQLNDKCGNYALGYTKHGGFYPKYVGRSDNRLLDEILEAYERISQKNKEITEFKYSIEKNIKAAYEKECENYHAFKDLLLNEKHPKKPENSKEKCHICGE